MMHVGLSIQGCKVCFVVLLAVVMLQCTDSRASDDLEEVRVLGEQVKQAITARDVEFVVSLVPNTMLFVDTLYDHAEVASWLRDKNHPLHQMIFGDAADSVRSHFLNAKEVSMEVSLADPPMELVWARYRCSIDNEIVWEGCAFFQADGTWWLDYLFRD